MGYKDSGKYRRVERIKILKKISMWLDIKTEKNVDGLDILGENTDGLNT